MLIKGLPPGRILYSKTPSSSVMGPPAITELAQYWDEPSSNQRPVGLQPFCSLPEAALYTTTFSRDFQALKGRLSCLWLAGTNLRESLRVENNTWRWSKNVNKQTNNTFNIKPTGDRDLHLLLAARRKNTYYEVLLCNANVFHCVYFINPWLGKPAGGTINSSAQLRVNLKSTMISIGLLPRTTSQEVFFLSAARNNSMYLAPKGLMLNVQFVCLFTLCGLSPWVFINSETFRWICPSQSQAA